MRRNSGLLWADAQEETVYHLLKKYGGESSIFEG